MITKALLGLMVMVGRERGDPSGLLIKMLKFELAKSSSLFSGEIMPINSLLDIST
jgi:hypothetical protein